MSFRVRIFPGNALVNAVAPETRLLCPGVLPNIAVVPPAAVDAERPVPPYWIEYPPRRVVRFNQDGWYENPIAGPKLFQSFLLVVLFGFGLLGPTNSIRRQLCRGRNLGLATQSSEQCPLCTPVDLTPNAPISAEVDGPGAARRKPSVKYVSLVPRPTPNSPVPRSTGVVVRPSEM